MKNSLQFDYKIFHIQHLILPWAKYDFSESNEAIMQQQYFDSFIYLAHTHLFDEHLNLVNENGIISYIISTLYFIFNCISKYLN